MVLHSKQGEDNDVAISIDDDPITITIHEKLTNLAQTLPPPSIFKVPSYLRQLNAEVYEPRVIAIGPYHRGSKDHLRAMEDQKLWYLRKLLEEKKEIDVSKYVLKMRELEERARECYAELPVSLKSDDFVEMLLLDGCFIVQWIRSFKVENSGNDKYLGDVIKHYTWSDNFRTALTNDMLLLENQLPFFVLWELFSMIEAGTDADQYRFMEAIFIGLGFPRSIDQVRKDMNERINLLEITHLLDLTYRLCYRLTQLEIMQAKTDNPHPGWTGDSICCATELRDAGIRFKEAEARSMFDISFRNGVLSIPKLEASKNMESDFRNLIAFEQLFRSDQNVKHVTDYITFMDCLIDSPKDVAILRRKGIIDNKLGDDKKVSAMFNSLAAYTIYSGYDFYYSKVFVQINDHRGKRRHKSMAILRHDYFRSPWSVISVLAAASLLLLTLVQAVFSILHK